MMIKKIHYIIFGFMLLAFLSCEKDSIDSEIEYQNGYPNRFAGTWNALEFSFGINGDLELLSQTSYDMIVAVDPNNTNSIIIDNIYNANLRVKANIDNTQQFSVNKGMQLEYFSANYDIETISLFGIYGYDNVLDSDILQISVGLYDEFNSLFDTVVIQAVRKTGFENLDQYQQDI